MPGPLKPLSELVSAGFTRLAQQAEAARDLTERARRVLPEELRPHVLSAARRGDALVVRVDSAAWAAQVRYAGARLVEALQDVQAPAIVRLRVRVGRP
jgi:hypothetical protein